jgi:hypothetical protein
MQAMYNVGENTGGPTHIPLQAGTFTKRRLFEW